jgi:hypothetical protein
MFTRAFGQMLAVAGPSSPPALIAGPIGCAARIIEQQ